MRSCVKLLQAHQSRARHKPISFGLGSAQRGGQLDSVQGQEQHCNDGEHQGLGTQCWDRDVGRLCRVSIQVERGKNEGNDRSKGTEAGQSVWLDLSLQGEGLCDPRPRLSGFRPGPEVLQAHC